MKVTTLIEHDNIYEGTTMSVNLEHGLYYYGIISEVDRSYNGKLRKKFCIEIPNDMSFMEKYVWFHEQKLIRTSHLLIEKRNNKIDSITNED